MYMQVHYEVMKIDTCDKSQSLFPDLQILPQLINKQVYASLLLRTLWECGVQDTIA